MYTAMSIVQEGIGFPILHPAVYNYMWSQKYIGGSILDECIPHQSICELVRKVRNVVTDNLLP